MFGKHLQFLLIFPNINFSSVSPELSELVTENSKWDAPSPLSMNWAELLACGTPQKWISG